MLDIELKFVHEREKFIAENCYRNILCFNSLSYLRRIYVKNIYKQHFLHVKYYLLILKIYFIV